MEEKEKRDYWSKCGRVFFHYGKGYGTTDSLRTICLGTEDDIKKSLDTRELNSGLHPIQRQVLNEILDYRKEEGLNSEEATLKTIKTLRKPVRNFKARKVRGLKWHKLVR